MISLRYCSNYNLQNKFLNISMKYSYNNKILPILLENEKFKETATKRTENFS